MKTNSRQDIANQQWLFLAPRSNETSRENFQATLASGYPIQEIEELLSPADKLVLGERKRLYIWGNSLGKKGSWENMKLGDFVAFYAAGEFVYVGKCILKKHSPEIARQLWGNIKKKDTTWEYVFFLDELRPIHLPLQVIKEMGSYKKKMVVQGFVPVKEEVMKNVIAVYGSLASFFDSYSPGLKAKDFSILEKASRLTTLKTKDIQALDEVTRGKNLDNLLLEWEQRKSSEAPEVIERKTNTIKRNISIVRHFKEKYKNKCQVCGFTFLQKNGNYYSEVAHIEPISLRKSGLDSPSNMVVLCPNHHKMLDLGNLNIVTSTQYSIGEDVQDLLQPLFKDEI